MIEIQNVNPIQKGNVLAICDVYIKPWHLILKEVKIFQKGMQRWLGMPSRMFDKDGERKYVELVQFDSESVQKRFRNHIMSEVDKYLEKNPNLTPDPVFKEKEELPF